MKDRCLRCNGYIFHEIVKEGGAIIAYWRCLNCGARVYRNIPYSEPELGKFRIKCSLCGKRIVVKSRKQKYCHVCRVMLHRQRNTEKRERICVICGKTFRASKRAKYCPRCRVIVYSEARKKYIEASKNSKRKEEAHALSVS